MTEYKLLAMDVDDTLLDRELRLHPDDEAAIARARSAGVQVVLATGRMYRATLPLARRLGITAPLITYQGAYIGHPVTGEEIWHCPVPLELALEVLELNRQWGFHVNAYFDDHIYVAEQNEHSRRYQEISGIAARPVGDLGAFLRRAGRDLTKVLFIAPEKELDAVLPLCRRHFGERLHITKSKPFFLEFSHPRANKGEALARLCDHLGLSLEQAIAVGDSYNDLEMLEMAGLGVAMGNAREEVKARADYVTAPVEQGGVARVVEKFIFGRAAGAAGDSGRG